MTRCAPWLTIFLKMNPTSTPSNKPTPPPPSPLPTQLSQELTRLAHQLDQVTRERDAARAEAGRATQLLAELEQLQKSDELIELRSGLWLRPSSIRDVEYTEPEPTKHKLVINGDPRLTTQASPLMIRQLLTQILPHLAPKK